MTTEETRVRAQGTIATGGPDRLFDAGDASRPVLPYCVVGIALTAFLTVPAVAFAQSPWEKSANALNNAFTGTIGRALAPVAIIVGGLMWMFGEGGARRHIAALIMGGGMVLAATAFSNWLFGA